MRKIKFRGKRIFGDEDVYGDLIQFDNRSFIADGWLINAEEDCFDMFDCECVYEVVPETVSEFTGITNYNKQEVFENDIVRTTRVHGNRVGKVCSGKGEFYILIRDYGILPITTSVTVIGNVFRNPELLV